MHVVENEIKKNKEIKRLRMSMFTAIQETAQQFAFKPEVVHADQLGKASKYLLVGMGGSHLAADLLKIIEPEVDIIIHRGYGLPILSDLKERLVILSSYSGNTQEVLSAYQEAGSAGLNRVIISTGGQLLEQAQRDKVPYVQMPDFGLQPRLALPLNLIALFKIMGNEKLLQDLSEMQSTFDANKFEKEGKALAEILRGYVPIIYASEKNQALAYIWKIKFNETGKIPAFYNVFSELNHNEMTGFDVKDVTKKLSENFHFIFIADTQDSAPIQKRMVITAQLYKDRNLPIYHLSVEGDNILYRIFNTLVIADWAAYFTSQGYGLESEQVPMVEEFKQLIK